jgi:hypothetical protein
VLDLVCRGIALLGLALQVWVILARAAHEAPNVHRASLERSRFQELADLPPQSTAGTFGELEAIRVLREKTPPDAYFAVFNQNTFAYYAGRRFIRDYDTRMADFYLAPTKVAAFEVLRRLGVDHVYLPSWSWPPVDKSFIKAIVQDPAMAILVDERFGYRIYRLLPIRRPS